MHRDRLRFARPPRRGRWWRRAMWGALLWAGAQLVGGPVLRWIDRTTDLNRRGGSGSFTIIE